jgi:hypothetical protein
MAVIGRLSQSLRGELESLFSAGLADVRVRETTLAGLPACARGEDVHFTPGAYEPWKPAGRAMLGDEVAYVPRQRFGRVRRGDGMAPELDASNAAAAIAARNHGGDHVRPDSGH